MTEPNLITVIPAEAGIQFCHYFNLTWAFRICAKGNIEKLTSLFSKDFRKGELDQRAVIEDWKPYFGKEVSFNPQKVTKHVNEKQKKTYFRVQGFTIIDKDQYPMTDIVEDVSGEYLFIA